ncbi:MAG: hypothetical protein WC560_09620 [Syntrophales bacterium]
MNIKKKILVLTFFMLSLPMFAQQLWYIDTTATGIEKRVFVGNFQNGYNSGGINMGKLPIQGQLQSQVMPVISFATYIDTIKVGGTMDTITISGSTYSIVTIKCMSPTDSLEYAVGITAPVTFSRLFPNAVYWNSTNGSNGMFKSEELSYTYFTKVFIKAYGVTNSIKQYQVEIETF